MIQPLNRQLQCFQAVAGNNLIAVPRQFLSVALQIILHGSERHIKKQGHLLLEHHGFSLERNAPNACSLLDFCQRIRVVQDVLSIQC